MATVTPNSVDVPDGGSTELTCLSNLHDVVSFEFDIQYTNATAGNVSMSEVPGGMKVTITEINFQLDVASSGLVVSCNVTFGTRYAFGYATINLMKTPPIMIPNVSTTQQLPDLEATSMPRASDKVIVIVLPIAIVLVIIGIVAAILLYCKSSRKGKPSLMQKNTSRQDEAKAANDQKMPDKDEYYLEPNNGNKILGLDQTDAYYLEPNNGNKVLSLDQTDYEIVGNDAT
ncbi:hypothetical protein BSL78_21305 [Apostichopus japonicus]|uniref:Uncharacterized protein n=1 Tax=Stichopus japonicus TaxID=307972 RepID=A0A2G8K1I7_STIJA|nr:hypothetical protein BSL78_21305 [Apostichopus japonicus]